ncbi:MAG: hypothetical protein AAF411_17140 [Myxococcota bacterium]
MRDPLDTQQAELTNFDKTAVRVCLLGAAVIIGVYFGFVDVASGSYRRSLRELPELSEVVFSPFYPVSMAMLMLYLAYYGTRLRKLYDRPSASQVLFLGILTAVLANFGLLYALISPASRAFSPLR